MSEKNRNLIISIGMFALIIGVSLGAFMASHLGIMPGPVAEASVPSVAVGEAQDFCDLLPQLTVLDETFVEHSSLYARYVTPHYIVLLNVLPRDCEPGESHCSYCATVTYAYDHELHTLARSGRSFMGACNGYEGLRMLVYGGLPEEMREDAVTEFVVHVAAETIVDVSGEQICGVTHAFTLERLFPLEVRVPAAPHGATSI